MDILYIDIANSVAAIRIAEQAIFLKEFNKCGHNVIFLLAKGNKDLDSQTNVYKYSSNVFSKFFINIPLIIALKKILKEHKIEIIVIRNSTALGLIPLILARSKRATFLYIKAYPLSEMMMHEIQLSVSKIYSGLLYLKFFVNNCLEQIILRHADLVVPRTLSYLNYLHFKHGIARQKMFAIPMGFDSDALSFIDSERIVQIRKKFAKQNENIILYFGVFHRRRKLSFILNVYQQVLKARQDVKLILIGGGVKEHVELQTEIDALGLSGSVYLIKNIHRGELYNYITAADLTLSAIPPLFIYKISSPTKVVESLGLGTPVVVNEEIDDQHQLIQNSNGGISVPYNEESFTKAIIQLLDNPMALKQMGENGQKFVLKNRTYKKLAKDLESFILNHKKQEV